MDKKIFDIGRRIVDYIRISVTDKCNLRCMYCMPREGIPYIPHNEILTFEEIIRLVNIFVSLGVRKVRLTGGEPLIRKGIIKLIGKLNEIEALEEICLTTNGTFLASCCDELKKAGIKKVNISIDTLKRDKFKAITGNDSLNNVLCGIDAALKSNFYSLKLNMVVMKGINDDEIDDFIKFSLAKGLTLRLIEFMDITPLWKANYFIPLEEIKYLYERKYQLKRLGHIGSGPAEYYRVGEDGIIGFIKTDLNNCRNCTRLRLTSTGELKICLYESKGLCLKDLLRSGISDKKIIDFLMDKLIKKTNTDYRDYETSKLYMCNIGG